MSEEPTGADAVARRMGLGARTGLGGASGELPWWRQGRARAVIVGILLTFAGYVFAWGDVEKDSRLLAAVSGGLSLLWLTTIVGSAWWAIRLVATGRRPYGRTAFNYGLVGVMALFGVLGADEFLG